VVVRCNFCNQSIANEWWVNSSSNRESRRSTMRPSASGSANRVKVTHIFSETTGLSLFNLLV
jgi:hypothetical protein